MADQELFDIRSGYGLTKTLFVEIAHQRVQTVHADYRGDALPEFVTIVICTRCCDTAPGVTRTQGHGEICRVKGLRPDSPFIVVNGPGLIKPGIRLTGGLDATPPPTVKHFML